MQHCVDTVRRNGDRFQKACMRVSVRSLPPYKDLQHIKKVIHNTVSKCRLFCLYLPVQDLYTQENYRNSVYNMFCFPDSLGHQYSRLKKDSRNVAENPMN